MRVNAPLSLHAYRDGTRNHTTMRDVAGQFSEREPVDLAAYYGNINTPAEQAPSSAQPAAARSAQFATVRRVRKGRPSTYRSRRVRKGPISSWLCGHTVPVRANKRSC